MRILHLFLGTVLCASLLSAQYFGQNKVRYETLDFEILKTAHFDIYYYKQERSAIDEFGQMAERWYARLSKILQYDLPPGQPIIVYANHTDFRGTTVIPGRIGETTGGVTEALRRRVVLPFAGPLAETDHVLGHELVHAFQYAVTTPRDAKGVSVGTPGAAALPLWFIEGMAEYLSLGPADPNTSMWMRDAVEREDFPSVKALDNPKYFPYRFGQAFWAFVAGRYGDEVVGQMLKVGGRAKSAEAAIQNVLNISPEELSKQWRAALIDRYEPILQATEKPGSTSRLLVSDKKQGGTINVSPSLSPNGRWLAFYSEKSLFAINLYLLDVKTGEIKKKLTEAALDPHVDSLEFANSSGAWSPSGRQFAFGTVRGGKPVLSIYDIEKDEVIQRIRFRELGELLSLTWSPDGTHIAFSATDGGLTDLFIVELATKKLRRITHDAYAELQPAWSPDGSKIIFVTDRFGSDLGDLSFAHYQLGSLEVGTGNIEQINAFRVGKHTNPSWSKDGHAIYFISDQDGISNIYRLNLRNSQMRQVTDLHTGVTGITSLSPAFSAASNSNKLAFSTFQDRKYRIFLIDSEPVLAGRNKEHHWAGRIAGVLPPRTDEEGTVATLLQSPQVGLSPTQGFHRTDYHPSLSLDYIAPPTIGMGVSSFGATVGGGTALYWSDMLGFHNLMTAVQTTSATSGNFLNNLGGTATYQNQKTRWTWGFTGGQIPYVTGNYSTGLANVGGQTALVDESATFWQIDREVAGLLSYPLNRAQRIEFSGGFRSIAFDAQVDRRVFDPVTGQLIGEGRQDIETPNTVNMGTLRTALVYDTSIFGGTSPIVGTSYRLEVGGAGGGLTFSHVLADFRRYLRPTRWTTFAVRAMHYGRYGGDAEDQRFQDIFIGYPSLVRGYAPGSFSVRECGSASEQGRCPVFDQLFGSRMAVGNFELRIPVFGALGVVHSPSVPPVETAFFYDAGIAWYSTDDRAVFRGEGSPATSYGVSLRFNILGMAIGQLSFVRPVERPLKGWHWEFSLLPGY